MSVCYSSLCLFHSVRLSARAAVGIASPYRAESTNLSSAIARTTNSSLYCFRQRCSLVYQHRMTWGANWAQNGMSTML